MNPVIAYEIGLFKMWGGRDVFVGITTSNRRASVHMINVYSWKLSWREVPQSLHSLPADPQDQGLGLQERNYSAFTLLAGLIFTTGWVALITFVLLFMWAIFVSWRPESAIATADIRYERIDAAVEKNNTNHDDKHGT